MNITEFDYTLPEENIAKVPPKKRGSTKLLVLNRKTGKIEHSRYYNLHKYLQPGDLVLLNDTKVLKARLLGTKQTGGKVELLILEKHKDNKFSKVIYKGKLKQGDIVNLKTVSSQPTKYKITIEKLLENGIALISSNEDLEKIAQDIGTIPIPPYLHREATKEDEIRYQTVFAKILGSVAAPTASLNFTNELKEKLIAKGVEIKYITLHVGLGTFMPVRETNVEKHKMHQEYYEISSDVIKAIKKVKSSKNRRVIAVGTTVTRALEHASNKILNENLKEPSPIRDEADIFIYPGYEFKIADVLLTNFHAPRSTVLLLASAFAGKDLLFKAYQEALNNDYKFLSYGDSMLIL